MNTKSIYSKYVIFVGLFMLFFNSAFSIFIGPYQAIAENDQELMIQAVSTGYTAPIKVITQNTLPTGISVPSLELRIPIEIGNYNYQTNEWPINDSSAFYASVTSRLNTVSGQTVLYAHNKNGLFGKVKDLKLNETVELTDDANQVYTFALKSTRLVKPNNTEVFYEKSATPTLVLITCEGLFDENRKLMYFSLSGVN